MLGKCLKYDLKSLFGYWWIGAVTILLLSVVAGICDRMCRSDKDYIAVLGSLGAGLYGVAVVAFVVLILIQIYVRYYQNFFGDEGYLTFTLPVRRETLFLSKILSAVICVAATLAVLGLGSLVINAISQPEPVDVPTGFETDIFATEGGWFVLFVVELILIVILALLSSLLTIYLCITLGATAAKKHKVLASVGFYYAFQWGSSLVGTVLIVCVVAMAFAAESAFPDFLAGSYASPLEVLLGLLICIILAMVNVILAFANIGCLERKLNLS